MNVIQNDTMQEYVSSKQWEGFFGSQVVFPFIGDSLPRLKSILHSLSNCNEIYCLQLYVYYFLELTRGYIRRNDMNVPSSITMCGTVRKWFIYRWHHICYYNCEVLGPSLHNYKSQIFPHHHTLIKRRN